jgi:hypothetical protein
MSFLLNPFIKRFSLVYLVAVISVMVITMFVDLGGGANIVTLLVATHLSAHKFAEDKKRIPEKKEKLKITFGCLTAAILISITVSLVPFALNGFEMSAFLPPDISAGLLIASAIFVLALYFAAIYFSYGWMVKMWLKAQNKK